MIGPKIPHHDEEVEIVLQGCSAANTTRGGAWSSQQVSPWARRVWGLRDGESTSFGSPGQEAKEEA